LDEKGERLNKFVLIVGVIVLIAGLALIPLSSATAVSTNYSVKVQGYIGQPGTSWTISKDFNADDILGFDFRPSADWSDNSPELYQVNFSGTEQPARCLDINITNPQSEYTYVKLWLVISELYGGAQYVNIFPDYYEIYNKTLSDWVDLWPGQGFNDSSGAIMMESGYPQYITLPNTTYGWGGGTIFQLGKTIIPGVYTASFDLDPETILEPPYNNSIVDPPYSLVLCETNMETSHPYSWLLPVGIPASVLGVAATGVGAKSKKFKPATRK
jgi:hypothetical protein